MKKTIGLLYQHNFLTKKLKHEFIQYLTVSLLLFFVPLLFGHPQLLVGTIVNALIIYIAINFKGMKLFPSIFLPALGTLLRGILFGTFTPFLIYLLPFIWVGNSILLFSVRFFLYKKINKLIIFLLSGILKASFLYIITLILVNNYNFPNIFLTAMGILQLITAMLGGILYLVINIFLNKINN